jgi:hypothetical protein
MTVLRRQTGDHNGINRRARARMTTDSESSEKKRAGEKAQLEAREKKTERKIDRDLEDSFPASDPPGWTLGVERPE